MKVLSLALTACALASVSVAAPAEEIDRVWRRKCIQPVNAGELRVESLFRSAGIFYGAGRLEGFAFEYRRKGEADWRRPENPPYFDGEYDNWRGMFLNLAEDADYECRVTADGKTLAEGGFRTWASEVPVARTVWLDGSTRFPLDIADKGSPKGWIRYASKPGVTLVNAQSLEYLIRVRGAAYVLIDDLRIVGGPVGARVIQVTDSSDVRIRNCEISGWGVKARDFVDNSQFYYPGGTFVRGKGDPKGCIWSAAVHLHSNCRRCVVERCWIHDPVGTSVAWRYWHPFGAVPICVGRWNFQSVVRFNDLVGSDAHRWDDAIISNGNFTPDGGFGRSSEVYGNFCFLPNDDCIELDGAQQCVACYRNRFEGGLVGISVQGNIVSPSFVFNNVVSGLGDYFGESGQTLKTSGFNWADNAPYTAVMRNLFWGDDGSGINVACGGQSRIDVIGNVFCGPQAIHGENSSTNAIVRDNRIGVASDPKLLNRGCPYRPLSFTLDTVRLDLGRDRSPRQVRVIGGSGERFTVAKNDTFDWFDVEPKSGTVRDGLTFTITFDDAKMKDAPAYRGAFLVRTPNGLSRAVTLYSTAEWSQPLHCEREGDVAVYAKPEEAKTDAEGFSTWTFAAPRDGRYYLMAYAQADRRPDVWLAVNDEKPGHSLLQTCPDYPVWGILSNRGAYKASRMMWGARVTWYDLKAGETATVRLKRCKGEYDLRALVMTDNPVAFEPKIARTEKAEE